MAKWNIWAWNANIEDQRCNDASNWKDYDRALKSNEQIDIEIRYYGKTVDNFE